MATQAEFTDQLMVKFLDATFVDDLLTNELGIANLFAVTYATDDIDVKNIALDAVERMQFAMPAFETLRTSGVRERIVPPSERWQTSRLQSRAGRLEWVTVFLKLRLAATVQALQAGLDKVTVTRLIEELGGVTSIADLRTKLLARYPQSVVDAFFAKLRITTFDDFVKRGNLYVEFVFKQPPAFKANDPANARIFRLNVCVQVHAALDVGDALRTAKLCRSILANEHDFAEQYEGGEIKEPYVFVALFPESVAVADAITGLTAAQVQTKVKNIFANEAMLAHFVAGT